MSHNNKPSKKPERKPQLKYNIDFFKPMKKLEDLGNLIDR